MHSLNPCKLINFILLCITSIACSKSTTTLTILVHIANITNGTPEYTTITLPAMYSTLGNPPHTATTYNLTLMQHPTCNMEGVEGTAVVFTGGTVPMFSACNTAPQANPTTFARVAQKYGAAALSLDNVDQLEDGRVVGFSKEITMPVLVIPKATKRVFQSSNIQFISIEIPSLTNQESERITLLRNWWLAWKIGTSILYGVLLLMVVYLFSKDIVKLRKRRIVTNNVVMKGIAIYCCIVSLLWCTVNPFGFDGILGWKDTLVINLHFSAVITVFGLILLMWNQAVGKMNFASKTKIAYAIYGICLVVFFVAVVFGSLWDSATTNDIFSRGITVLFVLLAVGFCVVGKDMLKVLYAGRNVNGSNAVLISKIAVFMGWYVAICISVVVVYSSGILGQIFELMLTILFEALCLAGTFVVLFFQPFKQHKPATAYAIDADSPRPGMMKQQYSDETEEKKRTVSGSGSGSGSGSADPSSEPRALMSVSINMDKDENLDTSPA